VLAAAGCVPEQAPRGSERPELLILVTIDTLRADVLDRSLEHGADRPGGLRALAAEGARAERAVAPFGRTTQSIGTALTGLHPLRHGADGLGMVLPDRAQTLAERLSADGWKTAAFTSNYFLRPGLGFEQGFGVYSCPEPRWAGESATSLTREALAWIDSEHRSGQPAFLWLHYLDPHWPYRPPPELVAEPRADVAAAAASTLDETLEQLTEGQRIFFADEVLSAAAIDRLRRLYWGEVRSTERALDELVDGLERRGHLDQAVMLLTADHGESLGEHRYWFAHGEYIYEPSLGVPFVVHAPGRIEAGTRLLGTVRLADVAPTLLEVAGVDVPSDLDGTSLWPHLAAGGRQELPERASIHLADHRLVRPENPRRPLSGRDGRWWAVQEGRWKLIRVPTDPSGGASEELYDLASDPDETRNLASEEPEVAARLRRVLEGERERLLRAWNDHRTSEAAGDHDVEMLRSLGYVR
jgi:arylsulfatase A-like enzyme